MDGIQRNQNDIEKKVGFILFFIIFILCEEFVQLGITKTKKESMFKTLKPRNTQSGLIFQLKEVGSKYFFSCNLRHRKKLDEIIKIKYTRNYHKRLVNLSLNNKGKTIKYHILHKSFTF